MLFLKASRGLAFFEKKGSEARHVFKEIFTRSLPSRKTSTCFIGKHKDQQEAPPFNESKIFGFYLFSKQIKTKGVTLFSKKERHRSLEKIRKFENLFSWLTFVYYVNVNKVRFAR